MTTAERMPFNPSPNRETKTPPPGTCWVCDEPDVIPAERESIPAICSEECRVEWVRMRDIAPEPVDVPSVGGAA